MVYEAVNKTHVTKTVSTVTAFSRCLLLRTSAAEKMIKVYFWSDMVHLSSEYIFCADLEGFCPYCRKTLTVVEHD